MTINTMNQAYNNYNQGGYNQGGYGGQDYNQEYNQNGGGMDMN